jgi:hypothetical protein
LLIDLLATYEICCAPEALNEPDKKLVGRLNDDYVALRALTETIHQKGRGPALRPALFVEVVLRGRDQGRKLRWMRK